MPEDVGGSGMCTSMVRGPLMDPIAVGLPVGQARPEPHNWLQPHGLAT